MLTCAKPPSTFGSARKTRPQPTKSAVDYTAAQAVVAALLASVMGNTVTASEPRLRYQSGRKFSALLKILRAGPDVNTAPNLHGAKHDRAFFHERRSSPLSKRSGWSCVAF
jgi:hypothetical protein